MCEQRLSVAGECTCSQPSSFEAKAKLESAIAASKVVWVRLDSCTLLDNLEFQDDGDNVASRNRSDIICGGAQARALVPESAP